MENPADAVGPTSTQPMNRLAKALQDEFYTDWWRQACHVVHAARRYGTAKATGQLGAADAAIRSMIEAASGLEHLETDWAFFADCRPPYRELDPQEELLLANLCEGIRRQRQDAHDTACVALALRTAAAFRYEE